MGTLPAIVEQRWRDRGLIGQARHQCIIRIRKGHIDRAYRDFNMLDGGAAPEIGTIWNGNNAQPWSGLWNPDGDWVTVTEVESCKIVKDVSTDNGSSTATIIVDDIAFLRSIQEATGLYGTVFDRGHFSPQRGISVWKRAPLFEQNAWANRFNSGFQVELWEGYGPDGDPSVTPLDAPVSRTVNGVTIQTCVPEDTAIARTWTGLIDHTEIDTHPDTITLTCRDFGILVTDQRLVANNKAPEIQSPVRFADRGHTLGEVNTGYGASASGTKAGYAPSNVTDSSNSSGWVSDNQQHSDDMVWVEIKLTPGYYSQFKLATEYAGMEMYVAVRAEGGHVQWNSSDVADGDWVQGQSGNNVPGTDVPYVNHYTTVRQPGKFNLSGLLSAGQGTVLRLYFTSLSSTYLDNNGNQVNANGYVAGVFRLQGLAYGTDPSNAPITQGTHIKADGWVLIDDLSDIVRRVLMWCGFKEMDVDQFGWSLVQPFSFGQDQFFIDVITGCQNQGNFLFYMTAPTDDDNSIGVPCFKTQQAFSTQPNTYTSIRDTDLLESLQVTYDNSNLPFAFRVRGAQNKSGATFGQDLVKRYQAVYYPPWSGQDYRKVSPTTQGRRYDPVDRLSGLQRHYVETQGQVLSLSLNSDDECMFVALLTAVQYALTSVTGQLQTAGVPGFELNAAVNVVDQGSGTNSRLYMTTIESDHQLGEEGSWHMTCSGSLLDTEDLSLMAEDWAYVVYKASLYKS